jgi:antitoxin component of MazEF toxin-antitoxin module
MTKTISKIGNSQGIIFDAALMDLARVRVGDRLDVTIINDSGAIMLMPIRKGPSKKKVKGAIKKVMKDYRRTLRKLA